MGHKKRDDVKAAREWLRVHGYPLEMRVASIFRDHGLHVEQAKHYQPNGSDKIREIDLVVRMQEVFPGHDDKPIYFQVVLSVECKSGAKSNNPWVVFTSSEHRSPPRVAIAQLMGNEQGNRLTRGWSDKPDVLALPLFALPSRCGFGVVETKRAADEKASQVASKAVDSAVAAATHLSSEGRPKYSKNICRLIIPVVVVGNPLLECHSDADDEMGVRIEPIRRTTLVTGVGDDTRSRTLVHVVVEDAATEFVRDVTKTFQHICENREMDIHLACSKAPGS